VAASTGNQASSRLLSLRSANALLELPRGEGLLAAGSSVSALLIGDLVAFPSSEG
jgi:gephyrin